MVKKLVTLHLILLLTSAVAINAANAGVTATAKTQVRISVDLVSPTMAQHTDHAINGITIDLSSVTDMDGLVTTINTGLTGNTDIVATTNSDGELVLTSESGQNIVVTGGTGTVLYDNAQYADGTQISGVSGSSDITAFGHLTLKSDDGSVIVIEDGEQDTHTGLDKLGLMAQSEDSKTTVTGLAVGTTAQAAGALTSLDSAIEQIAKFRASFGAFETGSMQLSII